MRHRTTTRTRRLALAAAVAVASLATFGALAPTASATFSCGFGGPRVCVDITDTPDPVSPSTPTSSSFLSYNVDVSNQSAGTVTHVTLVDKLPGGTTLVSTTPSQGTCGTLFGVVACSLGTLNPAAHATVAIVVRAPSVTGTIADIAAIAWDNVANYSAYPSPSQGAAIATEKTLVQAVAGRASSLVPPGQSVRLDTDPTGADVTTPTDVNIGVATVPATDKPAFTASIAETPGAVKCPYGVICRGGDWLLAQVPGTFFPALQFELHWNKAIVPANQTVKNLAVLHTDCLVYCPVEVITRRCSSATPYAAELPCLFGVKETPYEFTATLFSKRNGYMR